MPLPRLLVRVHSLDLPWAADVPLGVSVHLPSGEHSRLKGKAGQSTEAERTVVAAGWRAASLPISPADTAVRLVVREDPKAAAAESRPIAVVRYALPYALREPNPKKPRAENFSIGSNSLAWTWASEYELSAAQRCVLLRGRAFASSAEVVGLTAQASAHK